MALATETINSQAVVIGVQDNIIKIELNSDATSSLMRNEVVYICPRIVAVQTVVSKNQAPQHEQQRLKAEILRVMGRCADVQVYEDTRRVGIGDPVILTGGLLSVELGPGLLGQIYDGLQNPLESLAITTGRFLQRGVEVPALDQNTRWGFTAHARVGQRLNTGESLGYVQEGRFSHLIMVPQAINGPVEVIWIQEGSFTIETVIARVKDQNGNEHALTMIQRWPVRIPFTQNLLKNNHAERIFPSEPLITTIRIIDTFFPIAHGGTACIPGPFGAGKTVLQHLISRYSDVDIVIVVACGERAGEVVEVISEFPKLPDPKGGTLMDRTIIICNTSSMPVAAREASIYTGITLGEYYRQMGLNVLLLADSTSRWAQAMRERSGRLEEIPGEEAFPAYLESTVKNLYERAGVIRHGDQQGSLTMIGTVSPAGGNFEEPVTQATLNTVKAFLGLSADRAYRRFYPAIDPIQSWSRYRELLASWYEGNLGEHWIIQVKKMEDILKRGENIYRMMQVTGEEGVSMEDYTSYRKALFIDMVYLQQDAFDLVDVSTPLNRQRASFELIDKIVNHQYIFTDKAGVRTFFTHITQLFRNLNYNKMESDMYKKYVEEIEKSFLDI